MSAARYRIIVRGEVDPATLERIGRPQARTRAGSTELVCDVTDQSQLLGVLSGLAGIGIEVVSATPADSPDRVARSR
jgi:hypothetical protein